MCSSRALRFVIFNWCSLFTLSLHSPTPLRLRPPYDHTRSTIPILPIPPRIPSIVFSQTIPPPRSLSIQFSFFTMNYILIFWSLPTLPFAIYSWLWDNRGYKCHHIVLQPPPLPPLPSPPSLARTKSSMFGGTAVVYPHGAIHSWLYEWRVKKIFQPPAGTLPSI